MPRAGYCSVRRSEEVSMNWEIAGAIGEIVGAMAVVLSLVYLAAQIRVQTRESKLA